jgi:hypothetical protein
MPQVIKWIYSLKHFWKSKIYPLRGMVTACHLNEILRRSSSREIWSCCLLRFCEAKFKGVHEARHKNVRKERGKFRNRILLKAKRLKGWNKGDVCKIRSCNDLREFFPKTSSEWALFLNTEVALLQAHLHVGLHTTTWGVKWLSYLSTRAHLDKGLCVF